MFEYDDDFKDRALMMLETYTKLRPEIEAAAHQTAPIPAKPPLSQVLADLSPLPNEALFLGVASDELPVLLNLYDPVPGPLLIIGEAGAGKTDFLRIIAQAAETTHQPEALQFGVLTGHPDEWRDLADVPHNVGIFPIHHRSSEDFILSLASWAHGNKTSRQSVLLLFDDLETINRMEFDAVQNLRWLLLRGPARRVWPIITLDSQYLDGMEPWLEAFRTRIYGRIQDEEQIKRLNAGGADTAALTSGYEFTLSESNNWLKFWLPAFD